MKPVRVRNLVKTYGALRALDDVSLDIETGELFFLLGPSGCGKTTLLRAIAGFVEPDSGTILIGETDATHLAPQKRNTGMMFQSYALWPHMSIRENVAFGLRVKKVAPDERIRRTEEALATVQMLDHIDKKPNQLSGGQQQRVALARALVIRPTCLLLDEPLSNLDAKLRLEMRTEIRRICKESGITGIYVTHDQKEALSTADRIAVMREGRIMQVGSPQELYLNPRSVFIADFMGQANFLPGRRVGANGSTAFASAIGQVRAANADAAPEGDAVLVVRPESIARKQPEQHAAVAFPARVTALSYLGETTQYRLELAPPDGPPIKLSCLEADPGPDMPREGDTVTWWVAHDKVLALPRE